MLGAQPRNLRPACELAERVLLPGDPHRALAVAQLVLDAPRMFNHARGLWGYTGIAADGRPLSIQSTGIGGPSTAIVCEELVALGATSLVRIGTCTALAPELEPGDLLAAETVLPADGASAALGADGRLEPDAQLLEALVRSGARPATVVSADLLYERSDERAGGWAERGALALDLESAALLRVARLREVRAASALAVRATAEDEDEREALARRLGTVGYDALAATTR